MIDIYVINLKKRPDRLHRVKKDFAKYNLIIVEAIEDKEGWIGCFKSHIKCIQSAKEKKLPYLIVIEDDCMMASKTTFDSNLQLILEYLTNNMEKWNIFLGGVTGVWKYVQSIDLNLDLKLVYIDEGKTAHFAIYNSNSYDYWLEHELTIPIDKCWHHKLIGITSIPFITIQYSDYSDIENKQVDYNSRFESIEKNFKSIINHS